MLKSVAYFPLQCALNSRPVIDALLNSLTSNGIKVMENSLSADAVLIWSVVWAGRMRNNFSVYQHYRSLERPVIIAEVGALDRGRTWKISLNNTTAQGIYQHQSNLDLDRPKKLGVNFKPSLVKNPSILLAAQNQDSLQMQDIDMAQWFNNQIKELRRFSDRPLILRPHPRSKFDVTKLIDTVQIEIPQKLANTYDSFDIQYHYYAICNRNSGPSIQAALAQSKLVTDVSSLAFPVSTRWDQLDQRLAVDYDSWLVEIAHTEYTLEEISKGLWLTRLKDYL